ncbi:hypothetical protein AVEN_264387-1 [Araneus ventricosus]|uniref:Uncharacterized protein n=1 Tax=Araneus ventricosus TaxID=182803 RepID=A0A4Y2H691_ARAVE|nr:hypothetical protein AVEN_264387-1 [Araneus ventricosus]
MGMTPRTTIIAPLVMGNSQMKQSSSSTPAKTLPRKKAKNLANSLVQSVAMLHPHLTSWRFTSIKFILQYCRPPNLHKNGSHSAIQTAVSFPSAEAVEKHQCPVPKVSLHPPSTSPVRNCSLCNYVERRDVSILEHMLAKHSCHLCGFTERADLPTRKRHSCHLCDFVEVKKNGLRFHQKTKHGKWAPGLDKVTHNLSKEMSTGNNQPSTPSPSACSGSPVSSLTANHCLGCANKFDSFALLTEHSASCQRYINVG